MIKYKLISIEYDYVSTSSKVVLSQKNFLKTVRYRYQEKRYRKKDTGKKHERTPIFKKGNGETADSRVRVGKAQDELGTSCGSRK